MKNGFKNMPKRQVKKFEKLKVPKEPVGQEETVPRKGKPLEWWRRRPEA
jgi:hypothetical protein